MLVQYNMTSLTKKVNSQIVVGSFEFEDHEAMLPYCMKLSSYDGLPW